MQGLVSEGDKRSDSMNDGLEGEEEQLERGKERGPAGKSKIGTT